MERLTNAFLSLGSNLGNREKHLSNACIALEKIGSIEKISRVYETPPIGFKAETKFLNLCLILKTNLTALELLEHINLIEEHLGRIRSNSGYISRTIDIDIIFFGKDVINESMLTVPHPRFHERKFVLQPLNDLESSFEDPLTHSTVEQLLKDCKDKTEIVESEFKIRPYY